MSDRHATVVMPRGAAVVALLAVALGAAQGCAKPVKLVPAEGIVEIGGTPAEGVVVQFLPRPVEGEKRPSSFATTGADGTFRLMTHDGKAGAVVGDHAVLLIDSLEERRPQGAGPGKPPRLDSRYTSVKGGLTATVSEGAGPITLRVPAATP